MAKDYNWASLSVSRGADEVLGEVADRYYSAIANGSDRVRGGMDYEALPGPAVYWKEAEISADEPGGYMDGM
jgi:DsbC/DsbD-like thiol-disulfide interchange protein